MQNSSRKVEKIVWAGLAVVIITIVAAYMVTGRGKLGEKGEKSLPYLKELPNFSLTNNLGNVVSLSDLRGKVWVADIIFTRCPGPCARMTKQFRELQVALPADKPVHLVSLTADPEFDSTKVLTQYGERFEADFKNWWFLTGTKKELYHLAMDGLMLALAEKGPEERTDVNDLFIHSTLFVVVDKRGNVRGVYESSEPGAKDKILADVDALLREN